MLLLLPLIPILGGIATGLGTVASGAQLWDMFRPKPKAPSILDYVMMYAPQVINLIVLMCLILMYIGMVKKYKLKKIFLFYPALITFTYFIFIFLSDLIAGFFLGVPIIQYGLEVLFTVFYVRDALEVYSGKHKFENLKPLTIISELFK